MQGHLRLLYRSLKHNTTLEHLCIANNEIDDYKYINKLILQNHVVKRLDIRGNYMNEQILETLWDSLHDNFIITDLLFDSKDKELKAKALESVQMELRINREINETIIAHLNKQVPDRPPVLAKRNSKPDYRCFNPEGVYDLTGLHYKDQEVLIKYLAHCKNTKKVKLSNSYLGRKCINELCKYISRREIQI